MPYRVAPPRARELQPLEPEDEMRLALLGGEIPRGRALWGVSLMTLLGVGGIVLGCKDITAGFAGAEFLIPLASAIVVLAKRRRLVNKLRRAGFDAE